MSELKKSMNSIQIIGTLKEINLSTEGIKVREIGRDGDKKNVECNRISKTEFKNPAFVIEVNGMPIEVDVSFGVDEKMVDKDGKVVDNPKYKSLKTVIETYECGSTRVKVDGSINPNEYVNNDFEYKVYTPKIEMFQITSSGVGEEDWASGDITGVVSRVMPEIKDEEETGRLIAELYMFDYKCATYPVKFIVDAEIAEEFEEIYTPNTCGHLTVEAHAIQHGTQKKTVSGFGRASKRVSGYTTTEYVLVGGDEPFEEENEYFVDGETMTKALNEREIMINEAIEKKKAKGDTTSAPKSPQGAAKNSSANPFGASAPKKSPF